MNVSGILVIVPQLKMQETIESLNALPGVEVHHTDRENGRLVATIEAETIQLEVDGLKRIKALPHIILAEMVHHHFLEDDEIIRHIPTDLESESLPELPSFLAD
jgi:nitrate reductase NapD